MRFFARRGLAKGFSRFTFHVSPVTLSPWPVGVLATAGI
jgi:hypothetical protein